MKYIVTIFLTLCWSLSAFAQSHEAWAAYEKARNQYLAKNYDFAIPYLQEAVQHSPEFMDAYHLLAVCYDERGDVKQALVNYEKIMAEKDVDEKVWYNVGRLYLADKQNEKALTSFKKAIEINPSYKKPLYHINLLEAETTGDTAETREEKTDDDNKVSDSDNDVILYAAVNLYKQKKYQEALDETYKVRASDVNAKVFYMRGICFEKLKNKNAALEEHSKAVGMDDTHHEAHSRLGLLHFNKNNFEESYSHFTRAYELNGEDHELMHFAGSSAYHLEQYDETISLLTKYLDEKPEDGKGHYLLAAAYSKTGDDARAHQHLDTSADLGYAKALRRIAEGFDDNKEIDNRTTEEETTITTTTKRIGYTLSKKPEEGGRKLTKKELKAAKKRARKARKARKRNQ